MFGAREGLGTDSITAVLAEKDGGLWVGTAGAGLRRWNGKRFEPAAAPGALPYPFVRALIPAGDGGVWIASYEWGVGLFREEADALPLLRGWTRTRSSADRDRRERSGRHGRGSVALSGREVTTWRRSDGLLDEQVSTILDDRRSLGMGTNRGGLSRRGRRARRVRGGARWCPRPSPPTARVGREQRLRQRGDPDGRLWFAMSRGVA